jgi:tubulin-specific chaperone D
MHFLGQYPLDSETTGRLCTNSQVSPKLILPNSFNIIYDPQVRLLDSIDENIKHTNDSIQIAAAAALAALMRSYFPVGEKGPSSRLQSRVVDKFIHHLNLSSNPTETRGYTRALGSLPQKLLAPSADVLNSILACLIQTARLDSKVAQQGDAETRQNAIQALVSITQEVRFKGSENPPTVGITTQQLSMVLNCFLLGLQDYNTDRRGDVGSWIRIASMYGLVDVIFLSFECHQIVHSPFLIKVVGGLLKQLSEKLDNVRCHAGICLERLLQSPEVQSTIQVDTLRDYLSIGMDINWADSKVTYRKVVTAMNIPTFFHSIVSGLIISVGALTESVTKYAEEALIDWIRGKILHSDVSEEERVQKLGESLIQIFQTSNGRNRIVLPLLKALEKLFNRGLLDGLVLERSNNFSSSILDCIKRETSNCRDVHRLLSAVSVALNLLSSLGNNDEHNRRILSFLLEMLSHEFPRVRKHTADNLYVRLLEESSVIPNEENADEILDLLLEGGWQNEDLVGNHVSALCSRLSCLMGIDFVPLKWTFVTKSSTIVLNKDDFSSYTSLVNSS